MTDAAEDRAGDGHIAQRKQLKESVAATFLKLDRFNERLSSIRNQLAERQDNALHPRPHFDPLRHREYEEEQTLDSHVQSFNSDEPDLLRLPELPNATRPLRASQPITDSTNGLSMGALHARSTAQIEFNVARERVARAEANAATAVQEADRLTEDARIAMVVYSQNEKSWSFDERARRFQDVMQAKKVADAARLKADDERATVQVIRSKLSDPYATLRLHSRSHRGRIQSSQQLKPLPMDTAPENDDAVDVWILASPLLTLPFTPRDATAGHVLAAEKELSTHVVYYAVTSTASPRSEPDANVVDDRPPLDGWLCCSTHGVAPALSVHPLKSSLETRVVSGAGAKHLNGKYIFSGVYNGVPKFKSASGVELFRKRLPKSSTIVQGLFDAVELKDDVAGLQEQQQEALPMSASPLKSRLPSTLRALEPNDRDFKSMEKIGAWMGLDELNQKRRRLRDTEFQDPTELHDGDQVRKQEPSSLRKNADDVAPSRPEATPELCREWVLFLRCSRRVGHLASDAPPPKDLGLGCLKRHYYISTEEKESMATWAMEQEAWLEKDVLTSIIRREAHIERVKGQCRKCMNKYQQNLHNETIRMVKTILLELNAVRFLTVKVFETIERWRAHSRKSGFTRYNGGDEDPTASITLGWSACITVETGRQLYKGSKAFVSKFKRFCRPEDPHGQQEHRLMYLGYFATREEAEQAYDAFANAEARRLNTTAQHLPRRRNVFRSCGKHFAVESERLGPDYCIECKAKALGDAGTSESANAEDWNPPFYYTPGQNYILRMALDLDFLDEIHPVKEALNGDSLGNERFPLRGNTFLLPRTPLEDPSLAFFSTLQGGGMIIPRLRMRVAPANNQTEEDDAGEAICEALDVDRVLKAQQALLQELQIYHPELFSDLNRDDASNQSTPEPKASTIHDIVRSNPERGVRIVQALYWDRCAALRIRQERAPVAFREADVWCRPDVGEWASFLVRGKHQQHFNFDTRLAKAGKEMHERRMQALKSLRKLLRTPLYAVPSREVFQLVIAEGELVKGDVVMLEVKSAYKYLTKYDLWCVKTVVVQRWYRGIRGRRRARGWRRGLMLACLGRQRFFQTVCSAAHDLIVNNIIPKAVRSTARRLHIPAYSRVVKMDGERVVVSVHATRDEAGEEEPHASSPNLRCQTCIRRFRVFSQYDSESRRFQINSRMCTCSLNGGSSRPPTESWLIRAYNPQNNAVYRLAMGNRMLIQLLDAVGADTRMFNLRAFVLHGTELSEAVEMATNLGNYNESLAAEALDKTMSWQLLSDEAVQRRKTAEVELERAQARVHALKERFRAAIDDARRALDFESRPFHEAQAWDPLENANDWRLLVDKRHTEKRLNAAIDEADRCRVEVFQSTSSERFLRVQSFEARERYESHWRILRDYHREQVRKLVVKLETHQGALRQALDQICTRQLAIRDAFMVPTRRSLVVAPTAWRRTDAGMQRMQHIAIPGLIRGRNIVRRRILSLSNRGKQPLRQRLIVDVSAWPETSLDKRHVWMSAYEPGSSFIQRVYLDCELVRLLAPIKHAPNTSDRSRMSAIADKLLSICILDRFTSAFTLEKLQFYQHLRLLRPQFLASRWFQDFKRGRKCGDGDEIYRQVSTIDGHLRSVVVLENWGDLTIHDYDTKSATASTLYVSLYNVLEALAPTPLALHLWICCVKSNQYVSSIIALILKFVCYTRHEDGSDRLTWAGMSKRDTTAKRVSIVASVQGRRMLVTFRDTRGGDLDIHATEVATSSIYQLRLEWDTIRKALQRSHGGVPTTRTKNLLLVRNRKALCEWIATRLRIQSLLDHPDILAKSSSPLVSGIQVRLSFRLLNDWIASSLRNPLTTVSKNHVEKYAAHADALLYRGLVHEQLAFVPGEDLPLLDNKLWLQTRDFLVSGASVDHERHLKVDYYAKAHTLYARVRRELQVELIARREREEQQMMEQEDAHGLRLHVATETETLTRSIESCKAVLVAIEELITARREQWTKVFVELIRRVSDLKKEPDDGEAPATKTTKPKKKMMKGHQEAASANESHDFDELDDRQVMVQLRCYDGSIPSVAYHLLWSTQIDVTGTLSAIQAQLKRVLKAADTVAAQLESFKSTNAVILDPSSSTATTDLTLYRMRLTRFRETFESHEFEWSPHAQAAGATGNEQVHAVVAEPIAQETSVCSAVVVPPHGPIEEVALDASLSPPSLFVQVAACTHVFVRLFRRPLSGRRDKAPLQLITKRVVLGVLIFQRPATTESSSLVANPRASALAMDAVFGIAVLIPRPQDWAPIEALHRAHALYRALDESMSGIEHATRPRSSTGSRGLARRVTVQRQKQLLAWKQFSVERMQTTRRWRQQRAVGGLLLSKVDRDDEREIATLTTIKVTADSLEWMCGTTEYSSEALSVIDTSLRLSRATESTPSWSLELRDQRVLQDLFDEGQLRVQIPAIGTDSKLQFGHLRVEVDDVRRPRRLIISAREVQSQQVYCVDCSYAQVIDHAGDSTGPDAPHWSVPVLPVEQWRKLALAACRRLSFTRKNGSLCLDLFQDPQTPAANIALPSCVLEDLQDPELLESTTALPRPLDHRQLRVLSAMHRCRARRFAKHQREIRQIAVVKLTAALRREVVDRQQGFEWLRMTKEDWLSQEYRGMLVLDEKVLKELKKAFAHVNQRVHSDKQAHKVMRELMQSWLSDLKREMGVKEQATPAGQDAAVESESLLFLERMQSTRWWTDKHPEDEPAYVDLADMAEWWRQRSIANRMASLTRQPGA